MLPIINKELKDNNLKLKKVSYFKSVYTQLSYITTNYYYYTFQLLWKNYLNAFYAELAFKKPEPVSNFFKEETLKKCHLALSLRRRMKLKFQELFLSEELDQYLGYHFKYYYNCTAVRERGMRHIVAKYGNMNFVNIYYFRKIDCQQKEDISELLNRPGSSSQSTQSVHRSKRQGLISTRGTFLKIYIFCSKKRKMFKKKEQSLISCATTQVEESIRKHAVTVGDEKLLSRICHIDFIAKEVQFHKIYHLQFLNKAK